MEYGLRLERLRVAMRQLLGDNPNRELYLYGAGARGRASLRNLERIGLDNRVRAYVDDAKKYRGGVCTRQARYIYRRVSPINK